MARILIHGINYKPELTGIGKYTGEMVDWLAASGHEVRVVTAPPYYPEWIVRHGYSRWRYAREGNEQGRHDGVVVWRCPLWVPRKPGGVKRLGHLFSFGLGALPVMIAQVAWKPDLVIGIVPTLFSAPAALIVAKLSGARAWLHIQDFEVDAAFAMGLLRSRFAKRRAATVERNTMRRFDRVSTISERMVERLEEKGVPKRKQVLFPNWADLESVRPSSEPSLFRKELGLGPDSIVALYAGNLGEKQGLEMLVQAARRTERYPGLVWVIAGEGSARRALEAQSAGMRNVLWLPLQPAERLNELLNLADIHVLPQRRDAADLVMPSKLTGMLASGRPVVATATEETEIGRIVRKCGVLVPPGDVETFAKAVTELAECPEKRRLFGWNARQYAEENLDYDTIMARFDREILALLAGADSGKTTAA